MWALYRKTWSLLEKNPSDVGPVPKTLSFSKKIPMGVWPCTGRLCIFSKNPYRDLTLSFFEKNPYGGVGCGDFFWLWVFSKKSLWGCAYREFFALCAKKNVGEGTSQMATTFLHCKKWLKNRWKKNVWFWLFQKFFQNNVHILMIFWNVGESVFETD